MVVAAAGMVVAAAGMADGEVEAGTEVGEGELGGAVIGVAAGGAGEARSLAASLLARWRDRLIPMDPSTVQAMVDATSRNEPVYDDWGFIVGYRPIRKLLLTLAGQSSSRSRKSFQVATARSESSATRPEFDDLRNRRAQVGRAG